MPTQPLAFIVVNQDLKLKIPKLNPLPAKIFIGFSGGADSTAMLLRLQEYYGDRLLAIHFNHGIRPESMAEEVWCLDFCITRDIEFKSFPLNLPANASENEARNRRLAIWEELAAHSNSIVALAHHQDDVNENFFLRLMRGSGITGLTGLRTNKTVHGVLFWRPLLHLHKQDLLTYLEEKGVTDWCEDASNAKGIYRRNRVRNELIPLYESLATELNGLETSIAVLQRESEFIEKLAVKSFEKLQQVNVLSEWIKVPEVLLARVLRLLVNTRFRVDVIPSPATVERAYKAIHSHKGREILVPLSRQFHLVINRSGLDVVDGNLVPVAVPEDRFWNPLVVNEIRFGDFTLFKSEDGVEFSLDSLTFPLRITTFKPGDRMQASSGLTKKLKKIFNENKLESTLKRTIPIVWSGDEIIWIPSVTRSKDTLPKNKSTDVIRLSMLSSLR